MQRVLSKQDYNVKLDLSIIEKHVKTNESSSVTPGTGPQNATANRGKMINILATKSWSFLSRLKQHTVWLQILYAVIRN